MTYKSFNYYGYDKETYKECASLIRSTNRKHITILNTWFLFINIIYLIFSYLNLFGVNEERVPFYASFVGIATIFEVWLLLFPKKVESHNYLAVFTSITVLQTYGVVSSIAQPYMPATMFLVLLVLTSLSFIGNMFIMIFLSVLGVSGFLLSSYLFKTFSIAYHDTYNAVVIITLAVALHYTFQRTRVAQFILYQKDQQIQKELEIKSSFDALTGLLNRGKFFSIAEEILRSKKDDYSALCLFDLDGFKQINDNLGHQMGDKVIQTVGNIMLKISEIKDSDKANISHWDMNIRKCLVGRLGGDEFILFIRDKKNREEVREFLQSMLSCLNEVHFDNLEGIHASIGVTEIINEDKDIDNAYKRADEALYESKRCGKNQIHFSGTYKREEC
ncbi:MAG: GGDEF domain-containing protein [Treponema sp.]|nr:GGDEF domain-containing protein [Treponema sp.]